MAKKILQKEASVLRAIAESVLIQDIKSAKIQNILKEMRVALASQDDGVAIAAPQIGYSLRMFVISQRVERILKNEKVDKKDKASHEPKNGDDLKDTVFINPIIKKTSQEKKVLEEGCLSVRYLYGKVSRSNKATIEAFDENGKKFSRGGVGLLAQIFQHEVDHLNGILFIDKAKYVEEILPPNLSKKSQNEKK